MDVPGQRRRTALIIKFGQIGDVIMALPAARLLHEQGFDIHWACGKAALPLLRGFAWIHVVPVDDKAILRGSIVERARGIASFWSKVLSARYDLCANLYYDQRFRLLTFPIRARVHVKLSRLSRGSELIAGRHHTDEYARILLGWEDGYRPESLPPTRPDPLPPSPLPTRTPLRRVALAPGGTSNVLGEQVLRRWPIASYVDLVDRLINRGWEVVLIGGPEDAWVRPHFERFSIIDCIGTLTLLQTISACDTCDAVITHDTGPLHLAGLSHARVIGLFGPTDPATRVPRRPGTIGIWGGEGYACRPCYDGRTFAPCSFNGCLHEIKPEHVLHELDALVNTTGLSVQATVRCGKISCRSFN